MARGAAIVLRLVRIWGTRGVTLVLVHHQVMLAAGALVRSVLTAGAVGLARHTRAVLGVFVVAFRTLLEADCQIGDSKMSGRAGETGVLTSARANFTGFVARPADTALVREAPWRTATDTCVVETIILTGDALSRTFAITALRVALRITVMQYPSGSIERAVRLRG